MRINTPLHRSNTRLERPSRREICFAEKGLYELPAPLVEKDEVSQKTCRKDATNALAMGLYSNLL